MSHTVNHEVCRMTENLFKHLFIFQEIFRVNISIMSIHRMVPTMNIYLVKRDLSGADLILNHEQALIKYWQDFISQSLKLDIYTRKRF